MSENVLKMCGFYYICKHCNDFEVLTKEEIFGHLFMKHEVKWCSLLKLNCCSTKNDGLEDVHYVTKIKCKAVTTKTIRV